MVVGHDSPDLFATLDEVLEDYGGRKSRHIPIGFPSILKFTVITNPNRKNRLNTSPRTKLANALLPSLGNPTIILFRIQTGNV